ncbi:uncharacterized protein [Cherax quadricarinatus]
MPLLPSDSSEKEELVSAGELLNTSPLKACAEQSKEKGKSVARKSRATPDVATTSGATPDVATSSRKPTTSRKRKRSDVSVATTITTVATLINPTTIYTSVITTPTVTYVTTSSRMSVTPVMTADVATPHVATPHVATPHVATPVVPSSAVASTSTAADASASDSVCVSSAKRRVSMYNKITPVIVEKKMISMEDDRFDEILSFVHCSECLSRKVEVTYYKHHLETVVAMSCTECKAVLVKKPRGIRRQLNVLTGRMVYAEMVAGGGYNSFLRRNALCNLPGITHETFSRYTSMITRVSIQSCNRILAETRAIVHKEYAKQDTLSDARGVVDIDVTYDGTWHTRGHHSNFGIGVAIDALTKLVVDYQVLCKYCFLCVNMKSRLNKKKITVEKYEKFKENHEKKCNKNYSGSSGKMEVEAALIIWQRSLKQKLRYKTIVSDGDSATYKGIIELNDGAGPYQGLQVTKEECINHYAKRLKNRLTSLVKLHYTEKQLRTGKKREEYHLKRKGMLTDFMIHKLAQYFQKNLRDSRGTDVETMRNGILANFFHCSSTDDNPEHHLCPPGSASWCFYQKALADNLPPPSHTTMKVKFQLQPNDFNQVHEVYKDLTRDDMMERCIQGRTQNPNESLHQRIWSYCNKALYRNKWQVDFSVSHAIAEYNVGYKSCLDIQLGYGRSSLNQKRLKDMDRHMQRLQTPRSKKRKTVVDTSYEAGGH